MESTNLDLVLKLLQAFGYPGTILWAVVFTSSKISAALAELRKHDELLREALSSQDKRLSILERLLERHDNNIEDLWRRLDSGRFRVTDYESK